MTTQAKTFSLRKFLTITAGSREIGLIIAKDIREAKGVARSLEGMGFKPSVKVADLFMLQKSYFVIDEMSAKEVYDFVVQYASGQVEIFDKQHMQSISFSPDYRDLNLVLLVTRDDLHALQTRGLDLLSAVGPAFQS